MTEQDLKPLFDGAKSFYKKVQVREEDGKKTLISYKTEVCEIKGKKALIITEHPKVFSQTTLRHIKEFLKQNGFKAENKAQLKADYVNKEKDTQVEAYNEGFKEERFLNEGVLATASKVALMGNVLYTGQKEKNDFKKRMLKATGQVDFPADWDKLTEDEKEKRLNGAIKINLETLGKIDEFRRNGLFKKREAKK